MLLCGTESNYKIINNHNLEKYVDIMRHNVFNAFFASSNVSLCINLDISINEVYPWIKYGRVILFTTQIRAKLSLRLVV